MKGQTLLETLLALSVIMIVLAGIAVTTVSSLRNANYGRTQSLATQYAQEGIEVLRRIRNNNYPEFRNYSGNYCLAKDSMSLQSSVNCAAPNVDKYIRSVAIEQSPGCGTNIAKATMIVSWTDERCPNNSYCKKSQLITCLSTENPMTGFSQPPVGGAPTPTVAVTPTPTSTPTPTPAAACSKNYYLAYSFCVYIGGNWGTHCDAACTKTQ